jgi:NMD protein affecting ribosome stability and mRNA decay
VAASEIRGGIRNGGETEMSGRDGDVGQRGRRDRLIQEEVHDPYMTRKKPSEPSICSECGVVFADGRWQWQSEPPAGAERLLCPCCQRIRDRVPAGFLTLDGEFFAAHREEILNLVHNKVEAQKAQHPMKRLMGIEDTEEGTVLTFTDRHLPRGAGEAIESAYEGDLEIQYTDDAGIVRVYWRR